MFSRAAVFCVLLFGAVSVPVFSVAGVAAPVAPSPALVAATPTPITAVSYIVMDLNSGRILAARDPDKRMFPASTTKLMTTLVATENGDLNQIIRASPAAAATGESGIGLLAGENHTLAELLRAALIRSANDACVSIAEGVAGSQSAFVAKMNAKSKALGARNTHFVNPHGLHNPNHYTTARDLALIGQAVTRVKILNEIAREKTAEIGGNYKIGAKRLILNRNKLLWRWPACDGLKTGYTKQAGNCLVATATRPNPATGAPWRLLCVTMKSHPGSSFSDAERLLLQAFGSYVPQNVGKEGALMWSGPVAGGAFPLEAIAVGATRLPLRAAERSTLHEKIELKSLQAPVKKGARVGDAVFYAAGRPIARLPLVAADDVPQTKLAAVAPAIGERVSFWSPWKRWGATLALWLGVLVTAFLLIAARRRRALAQRRKKRRPAGSFERVQLPNNSQSRAETQRRREI